MAKGWVGPHAHGGFREDLGIYVRSKWEANFCRYLRWLQKIGEIRGWEYEPEVFEFPVKRGNREYRPDFRVTERDGRVVYYETKGYLDKDSRVKLARMHRYYPDVRVIVIDGAFMADLAHKLGRLIPGWED